MAAGVPTLKALAAYLMERKEQLYAISVHTGGTRPDNWIDIEGGIGTGADNGSWISTSYLIGEIVVIPLTDYLSRVFSFRNIMIGHATLLLQAEGMSVLTDPMFSDRMFAIRRLAPPGLALSALPPIDVVVVSHNHRDHLDEASVRALGPEATFVVPLGLGGFFRKRGLVKVVELDWWDETQITARGRHIRVTLVPAQHWSMRVGVNTNQSLWGGFVIESPSVRFYFAGDTGYPAAFKDIGRRFPGIDYALLPIGAYEPRWFMKAQHIGPDEAAIAFGELGAKTLIPMHWGTFRLSDEPLAEPPVLLRQSLGSAADQLAQLAIGETHWGPSPSR